MILISGLLIFGLFSMPSGNADPINVLVDQSNIDTLGDMTTGGTYTLTEDIDLTGFLALGDVDSYLGGLGAVFDGNSKQITGLSKPLFNEITSGAEAKNVTLVTAESGITATSSNTGVLAKSSTGTITNVTVSGSIDGDSNSNIGGIVGEVSGGSVSGSTSQVSIIDGGDNVGGLIGSVSTNTTPSIVSITNLPGANASPVAVEGVASEVTVTVSSSTATGSVSGSNNVGGLIGSISANQTAEATITLDISGANASPVTTGAVAAQATVTVSGSSASGNVSGAEYVGGLIGSVAIQQETTATTTVDLPTANASPVTVGGVTTEVSVTISGSSASGNVTGAGNVGGLIGPVVVVQNTNSTTEVNVSGANASPVSIGAVTAEVSVTVSDSSATGATVSKSDVSDGNNLGGLVATVSLTPETSSTTTATTDNGNSSPITTGNVSTESSVSISSASAQVTIENGGGNVGGLVGEVVSEPARSSNSTLSESDANASPVMLGEVTVQAVTTISDSEVDGELVSGETDIGGLVGRVYLTRDASLQITNSHTRNDVTGQNDDVGGLIGYVGLSGAQATITGSSASGDISGDDDIGGLIGDIQVNPDYIENCTFEGWGWDCTYLDVINSQLTLENSASFGSTVSGDDSIGGLIGEITVESWNSDVESWDSDFAAGSVQILNSHSVSNVVGTGSDIGGLIGSITEPENLPPYGGLTVQVSNSFAIGNVEGLNSVGGLLGYGWYVQIANSHASGNVGITDEISLCESEMPCTEIEYFGGLVGYVYNTLIEDSYARGNVSGGDHVGGLIGEVSTGLAFTNVIVQSHSLGQVSGINYVGGLIGSLDEFSLVQHTYASGDVVGQGYGVGGLIGEALQSSTIENSIAYGDIEGDSYVGGLVGDLDGSVRSSLALGSVDGRHRVGGLIGILRESSNVDESGAHGDVNRNSECNQGPYDNFDVIDSCDFIGGLVGWMGDESLINFSWATGDVRGRQSVGGLVGETYGVIENSWAEGSVLAQDVPGEDFVGFCGVAELSYCDLNLFIGDAEFPTNSDIDPSAPTPVPNTYEILELLNSGEEGEFTAESCINNGLPYLLVLENTYSNSCEEEDDGDTESGDEGITYLASPDPVQTDFVTSISPESGTAGTQVTITGSFRRIVTRISIGAVQLEPGEFSQTDTMLTFKMPVLNPGLISIQIFNGAAPVLSPVRFNYSQPASQLTDLKSTPKLKATPATCLRGKLVFVAKSGKCPKSYTRKS